MDFLTESFKAYPMLTSTLAIFAVMSLTPVLATISLTIFVVLATIAVCLLTVAGLVMSLPVILSITLFSSAIITLLASGVLSAVKRFAQAKERTDLPCGDSTPARAEPLQAPNVRAQLHDVWGMIMHPIKSTGWKSRLVAFILFRNVLARIFLPRAVRYHPAYPLVFGINWACIGHDLASRRDARV
ncbi:hypothetical protein B0H10DRAFT_673016 [Mycena sp. CBHHK59/15]|nr:hypothetical protein B0H10DRAFT_673016 [Mycena sp. CBHHK59/15]